MLLNRMINVSLLNSLMNLLVDGYVLWWDVRSSVVQNLELHEFNWVPNSSEERETWSLLRVGAS